MKYGLLLESSYFHILPRKHSIDSRLNNHIEKPEVNERPPQLSEESQKNMEGKVTTITHSSHINMRFEIKIKSTPRNTRLINNIRNRCGRIPFGRKDFERCF